MPKGIRLNIDSDKLKDDLIQEIILHQNGSDTEKACNKGACHLNMVVNKAALRQSEVIDTEKFK